MGSGWVVGGLFCITFNVTEGPCHYEMLSREEKHETSPW